MTQPGRKFNSNEIEHPFGLARTLTTGVLGVVIDRVAPGSEADRIGLQGIEYRNRLLGDIIVAVDNQKVKNIDEFIRVLENYEIGQSVMLDVRRNDQIRSLEVKIMDIS